MKNFTTYYYCLPSGKAPVKEFIDALKISTYRKFIFKKELLEEFGPMLPMPHAKHLKEGLYELRFEGEDGNIRVIYFFLENKRIIFVHAFKKTTQKTPRRELEIAHKRKEAYL